MIGPTNSMFSQQTYKSYMKAPKQTTCDVIMCDTGYRVENHTCVPCDRGKYNPS